MYTFCHAKFKENLKCNLKWVFFFENQVWRLHFKLTKLKEEFISSFYNDIVRLLRKIQKFKKLSFQKRGKIIFQLDRKLLSN